MSDQCALLLLMYYCYGITLLYWTHGINLQYCSCGITLQYCRPQHQQARLTMCVSAIQGTPTHMSPELFMAGHISKASDVFAYGILLYEVITGRRAYAGVPIPLLPHEVALRQLRPEWPSNLPAELRAFRSLAETCWAHKAQDRYDSSRLFMVLQACASATFMTTGSCASRQANMPH